MKAGIHNTFGGVLRAVIFVVTVPLVIRIVGAEEYGLWALVSAIVGLISLVEGGLSFSTTVFASRDLERNDETGLGQTLTIVLTCMLILATAAAGIVLLGADMISDHFPKLTESQRVTAASALKYSSLVIWTRLLQQIPMGIQQALHRYGLMNILSTVQQALSNLGLLWVAGMGGKTVAFMQWQAAIGVLALLAHGVTGYVLLRSMRLRPGWDRARSRAIGR